jgi:hypothetical protein
VLTSWEEGLYFKRMQDELFLTIEAIGDLVGRSKGYVQNRPDALRLPEGSALREAAQGDAVPMTAALAQAGMDRPDQEALVARLPVDEINTTDIKAIRTAKNRPVPVAVVRGETVAGAWTGAGHARRVLRLLEEVMPQVDHHARQADFGRLTTDELRRLRAAKERLRGLLP